MRVMKLVLIAAAALLFGSASASAVTVKKRTEAPGLPPQIWEKSGAFCAIKDWHPLVADCTEEKEGDVTYRTLTLKDGGKIKEKLLDEKPNFYRYEILESPLPVKNYQAQFALTPDDDDEDEINFAWSATFDADGKTNKEAHDIIEGIFTAGLDNIKATAGAK